MQEVVSRDNRPYTRTNLGAQAFKHRFPWLLPLVWRLSLGKRLRKTIVVQNNVFPSNVSREVSIGLQRPAMYPLTCLVDMGSCPNLISLSFILLHWPLKIRYEVYHGSGRPSVNPWKSLGLSFYWSAVGTYALAFGLKLWKFGRECTSWIEVYQQCHQQDLPHEKTTCAYILTRRDSTWLQPDSTTYRDLSEQRHVACPLIHHKEPPRPKPTSKPIIPPVSLKLNHTVAVSSACESESCNGRTGRRGTNALPERMTMLSPGP